MRAFEPNVVYTFEYPMDMKMILSYLNERGKLNIKEDIVERYYGYFSKEKYSSIWTEVNDTTLAEFAEYLRNVVI